MRPLRTALAAACLLLPAGVAPAHDAGAVPNAPAATQAVPAEVVRGVRGAAERMRRAIDRADSGAYMAAIDATDPLFAEEQRKWARDLRTRPVASVELAVMAGQAHPAPAGDAWVVPFSIAWTLPGENQARSDAYLALFRPVGLPDGAWVYAGRLWESLPSDHARILIAPGDADAAEMGRYIATRVAELRASVEAELGVALPVDPTIKIYPDMVSLQSSIALSYTDSLGGWNEPGESIKLLARPGLAGPRMDPLVAHELGHAVSFEFGPAINDAPWWALEGIAEIAADPFRESLPRRAAARLAERNELIDFARLADFRGEAMRYGRQVYVQGRSMVDFVGSRHGAAARNDWFRAMGRGEAIDAATRSALGVAFDELDRAWRAWILETDPEE